MTIYVSELNVLLVYPACSKQKYNASEAVNIEHQFVLYVYFLKYRFVYEKDPNRGHICSYYFG